MNRKQMKRIASILINALLYVFLAFALFSVILTLASRKDTDGTAEIFGYQMRVVTSDSMAKCEATDVSDYRIKDIPIRSLIFVETVPEDDAKAAEWYRDLKEGDVLTFCYVYTNQVTITHRIVSIREKETGGFVIELAGDNKNSNSDQLYQVIDTSIPNSTNYVIGRVRATSLPLGFLLSLLKTPAGTIFTVIVPCLIIILLEVLKIVNAYSGEKKKQALEVSTQKDQELEELRRRLAELQGESLSKHEAESSTPISLNEKDTTET